MLVSEPYTKRGVCFYFFYFFFFFNFPHPQTPFMAVTVTLSSIRLMRNKVYGPKPKQDKHRSFQF